MKFSPIILICLALALAGAACSERPGGEPEEAAQVQPANPVQAPNAEQPQAALGATDQAEAPAEAALQGPQPQVGLPAVEFDFGEVDRREVTFINHEFEIQNRGEADLELLKVNPG